MIYDYSFEITTYKENDKKNLASSKKSNRLLKVIPKNLIVIENILSFIFSKVCLDELEKSDIFWHETFDFWRQTFCKFVNKIVEDQNLSTLLVNILYLRRVNVPSDPNYLWHVISRDIENFLSYFVLSKSLCLNLNKFW
jgi:hypothetical protein